jgi:hypothetical protein
VRVVRGQRGGVDVVLVAAAAGPLVAGWAVGTAGGTGVVVCHIRGHLRGGYDPPSVQSQADHVPADGSWLVGFVLTLESPFTAPVGSTARVH